MSAGRGGGSEPAELPPIDFSDYYPFTKGTSRSYEVTVPGAGDGTGTESLTQVWTNGRTYNGQAAVRSCESATEWVDEAYVNGQTLSYGFSDNTGTFISSSFGIVAGHL